MKTKHTRTRKAHDEQDTQRLIDEIVSARVQQSMRAAGLTPDSPERRRCDRLQRRVLSMIKGPLQTWRTELLDELLDAQADIRARLGAALLFATIQDWETNH